ncbi:MAG: thioesterase family protein [Oscillospiraceae bacterium]|nr:thioesterase family protein [Oscillospiraceae bacterium]
MANKIAVTLATLESELHEVNSIRSGTKLYNAGKVEFELRNDGEYWAQVRDKYDTRGVILKFTRNGSYFERHYCNCRTGNDGKCLCKHIVATIFAVQGGIIDSNIKLGKTATVKTIVSESNKAKAVGSGSLDVFATPMMIALMEKAACECLANGLEQSQTSVGTQINVSHTAASPLGAEITTTATVEYVFGRKIEFSVTASDGAGEIGSGKHTRVIVDAVRFMEKANSRVENK